MGWCLLGIRMVERVRQTQKYNNVYVHVYIVIHVINNYIDIIRYSINVTIIYSLLRY